MSNDFFNKAKTINENTTRKTPRGVPWKLIYKDNIPYHVSFLHSFDSGVNLLTHFVEGGAKICDRMYLEQDDEDACEECQKTGKFGKNKPTFVRCYVVYVHDFADTVEVGKDGKEYKVDPVKVLEVRSGQNGVNIESLQEIANKGFFQKYIWQIKKSKNLKTNKINYPEPKALHPDLIGDQFTGVIPAEVADRFSNMTSEEVAGLILANYQNVQWTEIGLTEPTFDFDLADNAPENPKTKSAAGSALG